MNIHLKLTFPLLLITAISLQNSNACNGLFVNCCINPNQHNASPSHSINNIPDINSNDLQIGEKKDSQEDTAQPILADFKNQFEVYSGPLTQLATLIFAGNDQISETIRVAQAAAKIPNPLGISHAATNLLLNPKKFYTLISSMMDKAGENYNKEYPLEHAAGKEMLAETEKLYPWVKDDTVDDTNMSLLVPYCLEASGSPSDILKRGIYPQVLAHPLEVTLSSYYGNVHLRQALKHVPVDFSYTTLKKYLGHHYISLAHPKKLVESIKAENTVENTNRLFCSELATLINQDAKLLQPTILADNVVPAKVSSHSGDLDVFKDINGPDLCLKFTKHFSEMELTGAQPVYRGIKVIFEHLK